MANSVLAKSPEGTIQLTITIPKAKIEEEYQLAMAEATKQAQVPGFRKGKAPKKVAEEKIDKSKVYEGLLQKIVPESYLAAVEEHHLHPILNPKIELLTAKEGEDWTFRATTCEIPAIDLGNYKEEVRKALAQTKIWTPGKDEKKKEGEESDDEKNQKAIDALLAAVKLDLPKILIEEQVNSEMANLIDQTARLGITVDQYLSSRGITAEDLRKQARERASVNLKLQLILGKIAEEEKIAIGEEEVDKIIKASGDENIQKDLNSESQRAYIKGVLARRQALDLLLKL